MEQLLSALQAPVLGPISWAELIGDATGLACVWLVLRQHVWNWPVGLANNAFFFLIFWWSRLYADAVLQLVFAVIAVYGWWSWVRGSGPGQAALPVRRTRPVEWAWLGTGVVVSTAAVAAWLAHRTTSPVPLADASILTLSLAATYGQARKLLESWWLWIAVDVISVPLYVQRGLYPTSAVYFVFLLLCVGGLRAWLRDLPPSAPSAPEGAPA
ncbi:MAG: nicotinamide riboside transporter PnuC [Anaeromyxobacter sp.]